MRRTLTHRLAGLGQEPNRDEMEYLLYPTADGSGASRKASTDDSIDESGATRTSLPDGGAATSKKPFDWLFWLMLAGTVKRLAF